VDLPSAIFLIAANIIVKACKYKAFSSLNFSLKKNAKKIKINA